MASPETVSTILARALPDLKADGDPTDSSTLPSVDFVAGLKPWSAFKSDIISDFQLQQWSQTVLGYYSQGPFSLETESVFVATERGVRGRSNQRIGHMLGSVFKEQQIDLRFADFKYQPHVMPDVRAPNSIIITRSAELGVVGEVRMPWVAQYDLKVMVDLMDAGDDTKFRHGIGQLAHSMKELDIKYGFLTNYNQTVFVRQVLLSDGMGLE